MVTGEAGAALTAGRYGSDQHSVADLEPFDTEPELFDDAHRLVSDDQTGPDRIFASNDVQIRPADRRQGHSQNRLTDTCARFFHIFDSELVDASENGRSHRSLLRQASL
jgi:hypothetical protein